LYKKQTHCCKNISERSTAPKLEVSMATIEFSIQEKEQIIVKLQKYFLNELDSELAQFDADFLLDFIAKEMGVFFYNKGLYDAQAILHEKLDTISDAIYEIEQPTS
jgi:uncharacterized protein (DUF2164 family)